MLSSSMSPSGINSSSLIWIIPITTVTLATLARRERMKLIFCNGICLSAWNVNNAYLTNPLSKKESLIQDAETRYKSVIHNHTCTSKLLLLFSTPTLNYGQNSQLLQWYWKQTQQWSFLTHKLITRWYWPPLWLHLYRLHCWWEQRIVSVRWWWEQEQGCPWITHGWHEHSPQSNDGEPFLRHKWICLSHHHM